MPTTQTQATTQSPSSNNANNCLDQCQSLTSITTNNQPLTTIKSTNNSNNSTSNNNNNNSSSNQTQESRKCIVNHETKNNLATSVQDCGECKKSDTFSFNPVTSGNKVTNLAADIVAVPAMDKNKNLIQKQDTCPVPPTVQNATTKRTTIMVKDRKLSIATTPSSWHRKSFIRQICNKCQSTSYTSPLASATITTITTPTTCEFCYSRFGGLTGRNSIDDTATLLKYSPVYSIRDIRSLVSNSFNSPLTGNTIDGNGDSVSSNSSCSTNSIDKKFIEIESIRYLTQAMTTNNNNNNDVKVENRNTSSGLLLPEAVNTDPSKGLGKFVYI